VKPRVLPPGLLFPPGVAVRRHNAVPHHVISARGVERSGAAPEANLLEFTQSALASSCSTSRRHRRLPSAPKSRASAGAHIAALTGDNHRGKPRRVGHETNRAAGEAPFVIAACWAATVAWPPDDRRHEPGRAGLPYCAMPRRDALDGGRGASRGNNRGARRLRWISCSLLLSYIQFSTRSYHQRAARWTRRFARHSQRDEHETSAARRPEFLDHAVERVDLVDVVFGDGAVDLHAHAEAMQVAKTFNAAAREPGWRRKLSCVASSAPSMLMATRRTPLSTIAWAICSSISVPLVPRRRADRAPWRASRSGKCRRERAVHRRKGPGSVWRIQPGCGQIPVTPGWRDRFHELLLTSSRRQ